MALAELDDAALDAELDAMGEEELAALLAEGGADDDVDL